VRAGTVTAPYLTRTSTDAVFDQSGERFMIEGAGDDLWDRSHQYGTIYRDDLLASGTSLTTRVVSRDTTGLWPRAGLILNTDLAGAAGPGFAKGVALTGPNGLLKASDKTAIEAALEEEMAEHLG
jgi:hypothetical protein